MKRHSRAAGMGEVQNKGSGWTERGARRGERGGGGPGGSGKDVGVHLDLEFGEIARGKTRAVRGGLRLFAFVREIAVSASSLYDP